MVIGFKPQFIEPIIKGTKIHTIREDKHERWKPGMLMHMATGVRTKNYKQFAVKKCRSIQKIEIVYIRLRKYPAVFVDDRALSLKDIINLAKADGFQDQYAFYKWFDKDFKGKLIHWTEKEY